MFIHPFKLIILSLLALGADGRCEDTPGYADQFGYACSSFRINPHRCDQVESARQACCVCGGGVGELDDGKGCLHHPDTFYLEMGGSCRASPYNDQWGNDVACEYPHSSETCCGEPVLYECWCFAGSPNLECLGSIGAHQSAEWNAKVGCIECHKATDEECPCE